MGTKNLNENGPNPFWGGGTKIWSESILWQRFCFGIVLTTKMKLSNGNGHLFFKQKRVRYARADERELFSSSAT